MTRNINLGELVSALEQHKDLYGTEVISLEPDIYGNFVIRLADAPEIRIPFSVDRTKPEVFYTGGGIWISAMWLDKNRYAVTDNYAEMSGFCIYDHREEEQDTEFPCQNTIGEKHLFADDDDGKMTDEDRYIFFRLHDALLREADNIHATGPWTADIVHTDGACDFPRYAYRGTFYFKSGDEVTAYGCDWNSFCTDVRLKTGISLPLRKYMQFFKISDLEQIAGIDAAHKRQPYGKSCLITKDERFGEGWKASQAIWE